MKKLATRPKKIRRVIDDDDGDEDLPASSSYSALKDGLYCMPLKDDQLSPGRATAIEKSQENEDNENANEKNSFYLKLRLVSAI